MFFEEMFDLCDDVEDEDSSVFKEVTIFGFEDVKEEMIDFAWTR